MQGVFSNDTAKITQSLNLKHENFTTKSYESKF